MIDFVSFEAEPEACPYLPGRTARMEWRMATSLPAAQYEQLLQRGWRRFGGTLFRPACQSCRECRSLRVEVGRFASSKSQRRATRRNEQVRVVTQPASVSPQHVELFNAYHADMHRRRGWPAEEIDELEYSWTFLGGAADFAYEMLYYQEERLIGVGLIDLLPASSSSVYFFHDPDWRARSPGTFSLLREIQAARDSGRAHHYLGYWIAGCQSMSYKARFRPHELLSAPVDDDQLPVWQ